MKNDTEKLLEQHLSLIDKMQEIGPAPFFYTRLKARMENEKTSGSWELPFKPVFVISILVTLLAINGILVVQEMKSVKTSTNKGIQALAASYDQVVSE
jgi:hypothetical protein